MPPQKTIQPRAFSFEQATVWAIIVTIVLAAIVLIPSASVPFLATKAFVIAAGALITLALYILARLSRGNVILPPLLLVGVLWLPTLGYALSALFSGVPFGSAFWGAALEPDTLGFMLAVSVLGTLAAFALRRAEQYKLFLKIGAWALGFIAAVEVLVLVVGQFAPTVVSPSLSLVGSYQDAATLLGLALIGVLLALRFLDLSARTRQLLLALGIASLVVLVVADVVLVWTMVALAALGLFVEAVMRRSPGTGDHDLDNVALLAEDTPAESRGGERSLVAPLIVLAVSLFFLIGGTLGNALSTALHMNLLDVSPSWQSTLAVGREVYAHTPFFGSGPTTFGAEWLSYRDASLNSTVFWNVDFTTGIGFVPTSFVTTGILGALAWLVLFGAFLYFGARLLLFRAPRDSFLRFAAMFSCVATVYLFVSLIFGSPGAVIIALAFVSAGIFASLARYAEGQGQWGIMFARSPRAGFAVVFALTLLLLGSIVAAYSLTEHYLAQVDLARAENALSAGTLDAADSAAQASVAFAPSVAAYQVEAQSAQSRLQEIAASTTLPAATASQSFQSALSAGINAALTATRLDASDYQSWVLLGNLYASVVPLNVQGAYDNAKTAYQKAETLNPTNPTIPYLMAQLEVANKTNAAAESDLKTAIGLKQDDTQAIFLLSQLEVQDGNIKDALAAAEAAAYFTPTDPNVLFQVGILSAASGDMNGAEQALAAAVTASPQFANARYFLAAVYAKQADYKDALVQLQAIAALSTANASALTTQIAALEAGKDPFPANLLAAPAAPAQQ
jgi:cytochrome c-type biogenesis protein CcmH/NrfG